MEQWCLAIPLKRRRSKKSTFFICLYLNNGLNRVNNNQNHKNMKNGILIFVACLMSLVVASCGGNSNSSEADRIAQLGDSIARIQSRHDNQENNSSANDIPTRANSTNTDTPINELVGSYIVEDAVNAKWIIKVNEDESATIAKEGSNDIFYMSWDYHRSYGIGLSFNLGDPIRITFPNMEKGFQLTACIKDGYLYRNSSAIKAKDPKLRLPINKVN